MFEYKLSFESINPVQASAMEHERGKGVWKRLSDEEWTALQWQKAYC